MLVILFISVFEYTYFCFKSVFLSIYHIHSLDYIFTYTSFGHLTCFWHRFRGLDNSPTVIVLSICICLLVFTAGPEQVINEKHLRRELPPEEYGSCYSFKSETADHLPLCRPRPISIPSIIGLLYWQAQCS